MNPDRLNLHMFNKALNYLGASDPDLKLSLQTFGPPPMWNRDPGFKTLVQIILEQQVSLASARAAFAKLNQSVPRLIPETFLRLTDNQLKKIGFSRQKTDYCRYLAESILNGSLQLQKLENKPDEVVRIELQKIKGIGLWTADIYLLMALGRPDIWPQGDLALMSAIREVKRMTSNPSANEMNNLGDMWKPWRSVAARILWHHYLSQKRTDNN